jgi:hypothetical protein
VVIKTMKIIMPVRPPITPITLIMPLPSVLCGFRVTSGISATAGVLNAITAKTVIISINTKSESEAKPKGIRARDMPPTMAPPSI